MSRCRPMPSVVARVASVVAGLAIVASCGTSSGPELPPPGTLAPFTKGGSCEDPVGDVGADATATGTLTEPAGIDLVRASAVMTDKTLQVSFTTAGPIDPLSTPIFFMDQGLAGQTVSFELRTSPGSDPTQPWPVVLHSWKVSTQGIFESKTPLSATATVKGNMVSMEVPLSSLPPVATLIWQFGSSLDKDGETLLDDCNSMNAAATLPTAPPGSGTSAPPTTLPPLNLEDSRQHSSGATVTIFEVQVPQASPKPGVTAKPGDQLAIARVQVCAGTTPVTVSAANFGLTATVGEPGTHANAVIDIGDTPQNGAEPAFPAASTSVAAGACERGWITFSVATSLTVTEAFFSQNPMGDDALIWKLS